MLDKMYIPTGVSSTFLKKHKQVNMISFNLCALKSSQKHDKTCYNIYQAINTNETEIQKFQINNSKWCYGIWNEKHLVRGVSIKFMGFHQIERYISYEAWFTLLAFISL